MTPPTHTHHTTSDHPLPSAYLLPTHALIAAVANRLATPLEALVMPESMDL
ncbi:MAG: hypothetical protein KJZ95_01005 [Caldilinea sp.]|nr:hypothetical protein [Caldilinea sp.]